MHTLVLFYQPYHFLSLLMLLYWAQIKQNEHHESYHSCYRTGPNCMYSTCHISWSKSTAMGRVQHTKISEASDRNPSLYWQHKPRTVYFSVVLKRDQKVKCCCLEWKFRGKKHVTNLMEQTQRGGFFNVRSYLIKKKTYEQWYLLNMPFFCVNQRPNHLLVN